MNKTIAVDCDGVVADFEGAFCEKFGYENRHLTSLEERYPNKSYLIELFATLSKTYEKLNIIPVGVDIVRFLAKEGFDIHIVTARPDYCVQVTGLWLKQNKIPFHFLSCGIKNKFDYYMQLNPVMIIEDIFDIAVGAARFGHISFLIDQPWNFSIDSYGVRRIKTFDKFKRDFDEISETLRLF
jgi:uncharacterized HAD superfamily protein